MYLTGNSQMNSNFRKMSPEESKMFRIMYMADPSHVLRDQPLELKEDLTYEERPVQIVDRKDQVLQNKLIPLVKVMWMNHGREEATWEHEDQMHTQYPHLF